MKVIRPYRLLHRQSPVNICYAYIFVNLKTRTMRRVAVMKKEQVVGTMTSGDLGFHVCSIQLRMGQAGTLFRVLFSIYLLIIPVLLAVVFMTGGDWNAILFLAFSVLSSCLFFWILRDAKGRQLHVFRDGLEFVRGSSSTRVHFNDIDVFSFHAVRNYVNGAYAGLCYTLTFQLKGQEGRKPIVWSSTDNEPQEELEALKDRVASVMAMRKMEVLSASGSVELMKGITMDWDKLSYESGAFWSKPKRKEELRFDEIERVEIQNASCCIFRRDEKSPVLVYPCSNPNFYPGFLLLSTFMKQVND